MTIKALSFYLTELNPAYYYNESYLNDSTIDFINVLEQLQVRKRIAETLFLKASELRLRGARIIITVDNIWKIQLPDNTFEVVKEGSLQYLLGKKCFVRSEFQLEQGDTISDSYLLNPEEPVTEALVQILGPLERRLLPTDDAKNQAV